MNAVSIADQISLAYKRINAHIRQTPVEYSQVLSKLGGANVWLKMENLQITGSFKLRGALNKLLSLTSEARSKDIVTASTGNHGAAVSYALQLLKCKGTVFVPENASPMKLENIRQFGAKIRIYGADSVETELFARNYAKQHNLMYVSPYNDIDVMCGQGTLGVELLQQTQNLDAVFVAVGGGGLIGGVAAYVKSISPHTVIIGCQPENSAVMTQSVKAGRLLDLPSLPTLSDGTAGGVELDSITFQYCRDNVDDYILVSEDDIMSAMWMVMERHHTMIEGAAGVAVASFLKTRSQWQGKQIAIVLCGANIGLDKLALMINARKDN
jgi:threonine dehydratase